ncbi:MAG: YdeI/OmpD-associated family protein [Gemmatimonadaceae bacterium]
MGTRDPRVDAYIARSADFAQPILTHLREVVHGACPEVEEAMKWSFPHFMYKGMLCGMASFKAHCTFGFWKGDLVLGQNGGNGEDAMGQFGRITTLAELPPRKVLAGYVKTAMKLNDDGVKSPTRVMPRAPKAPVVVPDDLASALGKRKKAQAAFDAFSQSHQREYVEWITEAKAAATRERRLAQAVEWMAEGKSRNWKYEKC